jgi:hypothetical protein
MQITFHLSKSLLQPHLILLMGDLMDDGAYTENEWLSHYHRFIRIFSFTNSTIRMEAIIGNHDIRRSKKLTERMFSSHFGLLSRVFVFQSFVFYVLDSNLLVTPTLQDVDLRSSLHHLISQVRDESLIPIILTHIPLYRHTEEECQNIDVNVAFLQRFLLREGHTMSDEWENGIFHHQNQPNKEVINQRVTNHILEILSPSLVLSAHTHYHCEYKHTYHSAISHSNSPSTTSTSTSTSIPEITISTLNWRNRVDPSYVVLSLLPHTPLIYHLTKCHLPNENVIFGIYLLSLCIVVVVLMRRLCLFLSSKYSISSVPKQE